MGDDGGLQVMADAQPQGGPLSLFGDFGFVGGEDVAPNSLQNAQRCVNFYAEVDQQNPKEIVGLLGCPGLTQLVAASGGGAPGFNSTMTTWPVPYSGPNLPVRGFLEIPGGNTALVVISNTLYLVTATAPTVNTWPTLSLTSMGTLLTSSGPVVMAADNGVGYGIAGTVVGNVAIVDGANGYWFNYLSNTFAQIVDPNFTTYGGADRVVNIDGYFIFNQPSKQAFYMTDAPYKVTFASAFYALKDAAPDNLVTIFENKELLWLIGEKTTEVWYNAGGTQLPFNRLSGTLMQAGCKAKHSVARFSTGGQDGVAWFGRSERGENVIIVTQGFNTNVVSTPAFSNEVKNYPVVSDAIGYSYQEDTHEFYVLTFPTADVTWVYDAQSKLLHKRLSYDPYMVTPIVNNFNLPGYHRHRSNCFMNFQGMRIVGDYQNGALYWMTRSSFTDAGWPLLAQRRSPHIWDKGERGRVFMSQLQLDFLPGTGNPSGMGSNPQAGIAISRDGGQTFGNRTYAPIGKTGQTKTRTMFRRLGFARDSVVDLQVIDPVSRDLIGVTLRAFSS